MESSSSDLKEVYRSMYALAKALDEEKKTLNNASQLFEAKIIGKRAELITQCEQLLFKDHQVIGKKSREILWRKGYYEFIAFVKKNWHKDNGTKPKYLAKLRELLLEGIANYKRIAAKMEEMYDLDLKLFIDFSIINDQNHDLLPSLGDLSFDKSLDAASYALETIHSTFLSLGDLHRYFLDFKFDHKPKITRETTARFYYEAFKLNPTIGMAQNQLGTLFYGQNYDLDSIYHYLYSLICTVPFELSENNVCKLFLVHAEHLERLNPDKVEFSLRDFYARFFLIVDIFFFDKDVPDFNSLCHCVLVDLRKVLCSKTVNITEASLFKFVCILMFCMSKLKMINSQKVYSLNAFLVAVCSDLIDSCIVNLEQFILTRSKQNERFQELYVTKFNQFEATVRKNRENYKLFMEKGGSKTGGVLQNGNCKLTVSTDSEAKSQKSDRGEEVVKTNMTRSSDEAKESDLKTPLSSKSKKRGMKLRRRRKRVQQSDESSCYDSESEYDTDCSSDEEDNGDCTDLSSNFESDFSDMEDNNQFKYGNKSDSEPEQNFMTFSDNEDIVIEEESIVYPEGANQMIENFNHLNMNGNLNFKSDNDEEGRKHDIKQNSDDGNVADQQGPPQKLKYKNKYSKIDPNIIIDFACEEVTLRSLKILFDWLRINYEILSGCYHTNPEFIHKIMKLLNYCNIDVFTRKVYFERDFISASNVRKDLDELFNVRSNIPLSEDVSLRNFDLLQGTQMSLDWEIPIREKVTPSEENIMRVFKMVDFGFFICKLKKFNYNFCPKTRRFSENIKKKREKKTTRKRERKIKGVRKRNDSTRTRKYSDRRNGPISCYNTSNEEKDTVEESKTIRPASVPKKGYLRNRNPPPEKLHSSSGADDEKIETPRQGLLPQKCELMGKLWLKNEVETLEEKLKNRPVNVVLTPYIVVDSRALTEFTGIVKSLVKSRKFIVLIPNAVLGDLDSLKKNNNGARNAIRWLEQEFKKGNRYIRSQRDNENLTLSLIKVPRKLDRDATVFLQIAQFCNYIVTNHTNGTGAEMNIMTFLSGDLLHEKRHTNFSYTGIMDAIPVRYDQISNFYAKYRSK